MDYPSAFYNTSTWQGRNLFNKTVFNVFVLNVLNPVVVPVFSLFILNKYGIVFYHN